MKSAIEEIRWSHPDEIVALAKIRRAEGKFLSSDELLALKSRSFYPAIRLLALACGEKEVNKEAEVRNMYNELRQLDTIEDAPQSLESENGRLTVDEKVTLIDQHCYIVDRVRVKNGDGDLTEIIKGTHLKTITRDLGAVVTDQHEKKIGRAHV